MKKTAMKGISCISAAAVAMTVFLLAACSSDTGAAQTNKQPSAAVQALNQVTANVRADDDMLTVLDAYSEFHAQAIEKSTVEEARAQPTASDAVKSVLKKQGRSTDPTTLVPGVRSEDRTVGGAEGSLKARVFTPETGTGPKPIIVYFHGGGWVIADREVYDSGARALSKEANAIVVSVDYRRAPEAKFPAAWDDALASYQWVSTHAASIGGDPSRLALAGESAGGNLAVATAIAARQAGVTQPRAVLAVYPVAQTGSLSTPSYIENAVAQPLNRAMVEWFLDKLLRSPSDKSDPRLDLIHANLAGLPPVTIINAQLDPLRTDGELLEEALKRAQVPVVRKTYTGVTHEFFGMGAVVGKAVNAEQFAGQQLGKALGSSPPLASPGT